MEKRKGFCPAWTWSSLASEDSMKPPQFSHGIFMYSFPQFQPCLHVGVKHKGNTSSEVRALFLASGPGFRLSFYYLCGFKQETFFFKSIEILFHLIHIMPILFFNWDIVNLQCCVCFCCTATYIHTDSFPSSLLQDIEYCCLCYIVVPWCLSILYRVAKHETS